MWPGIERLLKRRLLLAARMGGALALVLIVWWPLFRNGFVIWDDDYNIFNNPFLKQGTWREFWKAPYMGFYIPLTYSVWSVVAALFSPEQALPFQILNLCFHLLNAVLFVGWLSCLRRNFPREGEVPLSSDEPVWIFLLGVLFLLHPFQVGAVAWHSGFRDLLALSWTWGGLWVLFAGRARWTAGLAGLFFVAALLSKPSSVYVPGLVLALGLISQGELRRRLFVWGGLNLGLAAAFIFWTRRIQNPFMVGLDDLSYGVRPFLVLDSFGFYVRQFFLGGSFSADYGRTPARVMDWGLWLETQPWLWGFLGLLVLPLFWRQARQGWIFFALWLIPLSPTSGLVHFNFQRISTVADHYFMPAFPAFAFLILSLRLRLARFAVLKTAVLGGLVFFIGVSAWKTSERIPVWRDSESLFQDMLRTTPFSHSGNNYLGYFAFQRQDWPTAERYFRQALASQPGSAIASGNLANSLLRQGRIEEARALLQPFLRDPEFLRQNEVHRHILAMNYLAYSISLASLGRFHEAFEATCEVFKYNPEPRELRDAQENLTKLRQALSPKAPESLSCPH